MQARTNQLTQSRVLALSAGSGARQPRTRRPTHNANQCCTRATQQYRTNDEFTGIHRALITSMSEIRAALTQFVRPPAAWITMAQPPPVLALERPYSSDMNGIHREPARNPDRHRTKQAANRKGTDRRQGEMLPARSIRTREARIVYINPTPTPHTQTHSTDRNAHHKHDQQTTIPPPLLDASNSMCPLVHSLSLDLV